MKKNTAKRHALQEQVDSQRLRLESLRLGQQLKLAEAVTDSVFGTPIPFEQINSYRGQPLVPLFFRDYYQAKPTTIRTVQELDRQRQLARYAFETNENAQAVINGLCAYVVGGGYDVRVAAREKDAAAGVDEMVAAAQQVIDEFVDVNELQDASDGCSVYDETYQRCKVEGEAFIRMYVDEIETTRVRFVEPDNVRPPLGQNWEGPWSFGILTSGKVDGGSYGENLAWDTQTPRAYNINYPITNKDEQVPARFMFHVKNSVKKNQKRGVSAFYCCDETLRGTQKLRYAAREGAKIRASIPYVRQHQQADLPTIQALQAGVITATAPRSDQFGNQYEVPVQQVEPGSVVDIPQALEMKPSPADPNAEGVEQNLRHGVETIAARFNAPPWLVGGTTGDASYADGLVKESPFYKTLVKQQKVQTGFWRRVFISVLEVAEEQGRLPAGASQSLKVMVTAEDPQVRNEAERTQNNAQLYGLGVLSLHTLAAESGHDLDEEVAHRRQEEEEGLVVQQPTDDDGGGGGPKTVGGRRKKDMKEQSGSTQDRLTLFAYNDDTGKFRKKYAGANHKLTHDEVWPDVDEWSTHRGVHGKNKNQLNIVRNDDNLSELTHRHEIPDELKTHLDKHFPAAQLVHFWTPNEREHDVDPIGHYGEQLSEVAAATAVQTAVALQEAAVDRFNTHDTTLWYWDGKTLHTAKPTTTKVQHGDFWPNFESGVEDNPDAVNWGRHIANSNQLRMGYVIRATTPEFHKAVEERFPGHRKTSWWGEPLEHLDKENRSPVSRNKSVDPLGHYGEQISMEEGRGWTQNASLFAYDGENDKFEKHKIGRGEDEVTHSGVWPDNEEWATHWGRVNHGEKKMQVTTLDDDHSPIELSKSDVPDSLRKHIDKHFPGYRLVKLWTPAARHDSDPLGHYGEQTEPEGHVLTTDMNYTDAHRQANRTMARVEELGRRVASHSTEESHEYVARDYVGAVLGSASTLSPRQRQDVRFAYLRDPAGHVNAAGQMHIEPGTKTAEIDMLGSTVRGGGTRLVNHFRGVARDEGMEWLHAVPASGSEGFYKKMGFTRGGDDDQFVMELKEQHTQDDLDDAARRMAVSVSNSGRAAKRQNIRYAAPAEREESLKLAQRKVGSAPVPSPEDMTKARANLEADGRHGGESRGGSAEDRRKQRRNLFAEFGGKERGYVVCPWTGQKLHWTDDPKENPEGYPKFERGKIFGKRQGGGYQLHNLIPESYEANRRRQDKSLRPENLSEQELMEAGLLGHEVHDWSNIDDDTLMEHGNIINDKEGSDDDDEGRELSKHGAALSMMLGAFHEHTYHRTYAEGFRDRSSHLAVTKDDNGEVNAAGHMYTYPDNKTAEITALGSITPMGGLAILSHFKNKAKAAGMKKIVGAPITGKQDFYKYLGGRPTSTNPNNMRYEMDLTKE